MTTYMIHDGAGEPVSLGTVVADPLPTGLIAVALTDAEHAGIQDGTMTWDAATRTVIAAPAAPATATVDLAQLATLIDGATSLAKARDAMRAIVAALAAPA